MILVPARREVRSSNIDRMGCCNLPRAKSIEEWDMMSAKVVRFIALTVWLTCEFVLSGCTSAPRAPSSAYPKVYGESPETIRTLGTDHQFSELKPSRA